jgi:hypothetical protein
MWGHMKQKWFERLIGCTLACLCIIALAQCGSSEQNRAIVFTSNPNPSIVIESDFVRSTVTGGTTVKEVLKGPWTYWAFEATNVSTSTITIFSIHYEGRTMNITFKGDLTGADYFSAPQDYMFELAPGQSVNGKAIIHSLPTRDQIRNIIIYYYGKAIGRYGSKDEPTKSYKTTFSFRASE